jgi:hypothetical protein
MPEIDRKEINARVSELRLFRQSRYKPSVSGTSKKRGFHFHMFIWERRHPPEAFSLNPSESLSFVHPPDSQVFTREGIRDNLYCLE